MQHPPSHLRIVVLPDPPRDLVAPEVESLEVDPGELELLGRRVLSRGVLHDAIVPQHVHQRRLTRVVQTEEKDLGVLAPALTNQIDVRFKMLLVAGQRRL